MATSKQSPLTTDEIAAFCRQLPGAREDVKWGSNWVFSVAGNKMFAIIHFLGDGLAFKVDGDLFLGYVDRPGIVPAPYLARAHWIKMSGSQPAMQRTELFTALTHSHQLVVRKLPKRLQPGLLLDE